MNNDFVFFTKCFFYDIHIRKYGINWGQYAIMRTTFQPKLLTFDELIIFNYH
jgi:hypothetical protein